MQPNRKRSRIVKRTNKVFMFKSRRMPPRRARQYLTEAEELEVAHRYDLDFRNPPRRHHLTNKIRAMREYEEAFVYKIINTLYRYNKKTVRPDYLERVWRSAFKPDNEASSVASSVPLPPDDDDLFDIPTIRETLITRQKATLDRIENELAEKKERKRVLEEELAEVNAWLAEEEQKFAKYAMTYHHLLAENVPAEV